MKVIKTVRLLNEIPDERITAMIEMRLEDQEAGMMEELLETYLSDLSFEIGRTDEYDFRQELKRKKHMVQDVISRMHEKAS